MSGGRQYHNTGTQGTGQRQYHSGGRGGRQYHNHNNSTSGNDSTSDTPASLSMPQTDTSSSNTGNTNTINTNSTQPGNWRNFLSEDDDRRIKGVGVSSGTSSGTNSDSVSKGSSASSSTSSHNNLKNPEPISEDSDRSLLMSPKRVDVINSAGKTEEAFVTQEEDSSSDDEIGNDGDHSYDSSILDDQETEIPKLESTWGVWHDCYIGGGKSAEDYEANLNLIYTFNTVKDFWGCFNNLPGIDELTAKSSYHMMLDGVKPIWEDPRTCEGGFWVFRVKKEYTMYVWEQLVLACIGEQFTEEILGVTVSMRQNDDIIQLWIGNYDFQNHTVVEKVRDLLPKQPDMIKPPFFKPCRAHSAFSEQVVTKKTKRNSTSSMTSSNSNTSISSQQ